MSAVFEASVRSLGKAYADGTPQLEINLPVHRAEGFPFRTGRPVGIKLRIAGEDYDASVRATSRHTHVWISPTLFSSGASRLTLGRVLTDAGLQANDSVRLKVDGSVVEVQRQGTIVGSKHV